MTASSPSSTDRIDDIVSRMLAVIARDIVPMTHAATAAGNKVFGAAILRKADLSASHQPYLFLRRLDSSDASA